MTKKQNRQKAKRAMRKAEKGSTLTQDKMLGGVMRRNYGGGQVSQDRAERHSDRDFDVVTGE
jgi:hypothetical protein